jgi:hypothetical protein
MHQMPDLDDWNLWVLCVRMPDPVARCDSDRHYVVGVYSKHVVEEAFIASFMKDLKRALRY